MFNISFDFNEKTQTISNVKVIPYGVSKVCDIEVGDNKLILSPKALQLLNVEAGDRISINYWTENSSTTYPIISKTEVFDNGEDGTKLTKSSTISFRGQQRNTLLKFGSAFSMEEWTKEGAFKLVPVKEDEEKENVDAEENILLDLNTTDIEDEIADMLKDDEDCLPF